MQVNSQAIFAHIIHPMNPLLRLLLCCSCFVPALSLHAQRLVAGTITGSDGKPLEFASMALLRAGDSSLLRSTLSDASGHFSMNLPRQEAALLQATAMGYTTYWLAVEAGGNDKAQLQLVLLPSGKVLDDVTIRADKPLIERQADRTIFNTAQSIAANGGDAWELLGHAPGVKTDNGEVSIAGKSTVSVMINDRLLQVTGEELESMLRSLPAASVSRIEVITAPPARYDAEGNSGIVNIVTKKNIRNGLNGTLTLGYEQRSKASQNLQTAFNYRQGRLNVYGNVNMNRLRFISRQQTSTFYPEQEQEQVLQQDNRPLYTWGQLGADIDLGKRSVLGFLFTRGSMDTRRDEDIATGIWRLPLRLQDSVLRTDAFATDKGRRYVYNLNYEYRIDSSGRKLALNTDYFTRSGHKTRDFTTAGFLPGGDATGTGSDNRTAGDQQTDISTTRADLEWPLSFVQLSAGLKATFIHNHADNRFDYLEQGRYVKDTGKTNTFDYRENTQAAYLSVRKSIGPWQAQLGLRAEYTQTEGISGTLGQANTNRYFKLFPSAYLQYRAGEDHSWNINYTRRINRPSFWVMNPFRVYSTATAYEEGNPFLQPSFGNNLELGYTFRSLLSVTVFAQRVTASSTRVSHIDTANRTFYFSQANAGNEAQYGFRASLSWSPLPWWETHTELAGVYSSFRSDYYAQPVQYGRPSFSLETDNTFILDRNRRLMAELGFRYNSPQQSEFDRQRYSANLNAGIRALLLHERLVLALSVSDILKTDIWQLENQYNGTFQRSYFDERGMELSLTWKFGNSGIKGRRERNTGLEDAGRAN